MTQESYCTPSAVLAINDTINALSGKWKLPILAAMSTQRTRFNDIRRAVPKLTAGMLSKELRELEINGLVSRSIPGAAMQHVVYELTPSAKQLSTVFDAMISWGLQHRKAVFSGLAY